MLKIQQFSNKMGVVQFAEKSDFVWGWGWGVGGGVIFQNGFSQKAVQPEAHGFRGDPKANLEVFCHEATFKCTVKC
jgi:hypothetical protein